MGNYDHTDVRCFKRSDATGSLRPGIWIMTRPTGRRGMFIHGDRNEIQSPGYLVEELSEWSRIDEPGIEVEEITPDDVIELFGDTWDEGVKQVKEVFERHRTDKVELTQRLVCPDCEREYGLREICQLSHEHCLGGMGQDSNCSLCGQPSGGTWINVYSVATPDHRTAGKLVYVGGHTSFGAQACEHVDPEVAKERLRKQVGDGVFVDTGEKLYWVPIPCKS